MKNSKIDARFENQILVVKFAENALVDLNDMKEIYAFADKMAAGKSYGTLFESAGHYELSEEAVQYISENPSNKYILGKAYVVNSKESETKTKFHLLFDHPSVKPFVFKTAAGGMAWLKTLVDKAGH